jgi:hypothetical protein
MTTARTPDPPPLERHQHASTAFRVLCRFAPVEVARWLCSRAHEGAERLHVLEASFLEQPQRGPSYVVPPPRPEPTGTPEAAFKQAVTEALARGVAAAGGELKAVPFDPDEAARQTMAKGGCEVELAVSGTKGDNAEPFPTLLGVALPGEHDDGAAMPWHMLEKMGWHIQAILRLFRPPPQRYGFESIALYLWPGTGLKDPQENCPVWKGESDLADLLGTLFTARGGDDARERQRQTRRKGNLERIEYHRALDRQRREAAEKRRALTGDAGITDEELAALVPDVDVEHDYYQLRLWYPIIRLWEEPADALIEELPPECLGLCLFGHRPPGVSAEDLFVRCARVLRRALRGADKGRRQRAAASLAALAGAHVGPEVVTRVILEAKLL